MKSKKIVVNYNNVNEYIKEKDNRREMERTRLTVSKYNADK